MPLRCSASGDQERLISPTPFSDPFAVPGWPIPHVDDCGSAGSAMGSVMRSLPSCFEEEPPSVEVQCHGGEAAVSLVVGALQEAGAGSYDGPPLANQSSDDHFAHDALVDLARASTLLTAEILLDQAQGASALALCRLTGSVYDEPDRAVAEIEALVRHSHVGLRLLNGWRVVIAGRPNVGKSRLFNALAGFTRAIVDPTPGTTRDVVSFKTSFAGWPIELVDTAGLRDTLDPIETIGIAHSRREQQQADLIVLVLDRSLPLELVDLELIAANPRALLVANKSDLDLAWHDADSSADARDIGDRLSRIESWTDEFDRRDRRAASRRTTAPGAAVPFRADQGDALVEIRARLDRRRSSGGCAPADCS